MERHFTVTVYIFYQGKILLHRHAKYGKWLPPGGHVESNETFPEAARREVKEETGLDIEFFEQENLKIEAANATSFPRPFLCLLEEIPPHKETPAHQHMDMIYLAKPINNRLPKNLNEFSWFRRDQLHEIENELFPDVKEVISLLFKDEKQFV